MLECPQGFRCISFLVGIFAQENRRWMREQRCLGKRPIFWPPFSVNISSVCLRSLHKINILHIEQIIILVRPGHCTIACERVFNLHAWPTGERPPLQRVSSCGSLRPLKGTISDDYQIQPSEHHSPNFTKGFSVILSCTLAATFLWIPRITNKLSWSKQSKRSLQHWGKKKKPAIFIFLEYRLPQERSKPTEKWKHVAVKRKRTCKSLLTDVCGKIRMARR